MSERIAVITGAGQGAGRTIALQLAAQGFHVELLGRTASKLESVASEIGGKAHTYTLDLTSRAQLQAFMDDVQKRFDHVDVLVNCAGEAYISTLDQTNDDDLERILAINLRVPIQMARGLLPLLRKSAMRVLSISSVKFRWAVIPKSPPTPQPKPDCWASASRWQQNCVPTVSGWGPSAPERWTPRCAGMQRRTLNGAWSLIRK